jgi:hypothetical protein
LHLEILSHLRGKLNRETDPLLKPMGRPVRVTVYELKSNSMPKVSLMIIHSRSHQPWNILFLVRIRGEKNGKSNDEDYNCRSCPDRSRPCKESPTGISLNLKPQSSQNISPQFQRRYSDSMGIEFSAVVQEFLFVSKEISAGGAFIQMGLHTDNFLYIELTIQAGMEQLLQVFTNIHLILLHL